MSPQTFKHFRILELLGKGGMGEVYLALDTTLERKVALKFLPRDLLRDPSAQGRLLDEARSVSRVQHPNIAVVHSIEEDGGIFALCMEYVDGVTLKQMIGKGHIALQQIVRIAADIAAGMHAAHEKGIVHRDLKPANVMVSRRGEIKVMDFGLALRPERVVNTAGPNTYGTVQYMSPEQARGEKLTAHSDIFSFGSLLYELITRRPPFAAANDLAILHAIIHTEPDALREQRRDVTPALEQVVRGCMAKMAAHRWESMAAIREELLYVHPTVEAGPRDLISELSEGLAEPRTQPHHQPDNAGRVGRRNAVPAPGGQPASAARIDSPGLDIPSGFVVHEVRDQSDVAREISHSTSRPLTIDTNAISVSTPLNARTAEYVSRPSSGSASGRFSKSTPPSVLGPEINLDAQTNQSRSKPLEFRSTVEQFDKMVREPEHDFAANPDDRRTAIAREAARRAQQSRPLPVPRNSGVQDWVDDDAVPATTVRAGRRSGPKSRVASTMVPLLLAFLVLAAVGLSFLSRLGLGPDLPALWQKWVSNSSGTAIEAVQESDASDGDEAGLSPSAVSSPVPAALPVEIPLEEPVDAESVDAGADENPGPLGSNPAESDAEAPIVDEPQETRPPEATATGEDEEAAPDPGR